MTKKNDGGRGEMVMSELNDCENGHCLHAIGWQNKSTFPVVKKCCWCGFVITIKADASIYHGPCLEKQEPEHE